MIKFKYSLFALLILFIACSKDSDMGSGDTGTGGSMARFTIKGNYLYTVDFETINVFDISNPDDIKQVDQQHAGFGIETIFPADGLLFLGARNGMHIYSLDNPAKPLKISFTPHFVSYDPVVVQGNYAYVTLRSETSSSGRFNMLQIYDIRKLNSPQLLEEYPMSGPKGLGIDGDRLFICDDVLKVFKVTNHINLELEKSFNIPAIDVIPYGDKLYVVAEDGFYQYDYTGETIFLVSKIAIPANP